MGGAGDKAREGATHLLVIGGGVRRSDARLGAIVCDVDEGM
jgi:hypothetical protein